MWQSKMPPKSRDKVQRIQKDIYFMSILHAYAAKAVL